MSEPVHFDDPHVCALLMRLKQHAQDAPEFDGRGGWFNISYERQEGGREYWEVEVGLNDPNRNVCHRGTWLREQLGDERVDEPIHRPGVA